MLNMIKKMGMNKRSTEFAGHSPILSDKVISTYKMLDQVSGGVPRWVPKPKDET
ncbi:hypothetical protein [Pseudoalteromonas xiamenensis]